MNQQIVELRDAIKRALRNEDNLCENIRENLILELMKDLLELLPNVRSFMISFDYGLDLSVSRRAGELTWNMDDLDNFIRDNKK